MTIEKKIRVEDFRLLRQRFNRATIEGFTNTTKSNDKTAGKKIFFCYYLNNICIFFFCWCWFIGSLNKEEFIESFETILDLTQYGNQLEKLFDKVQQ